MARLTLPLLAAAVLVSGCVVRSAPAEPTSCEFTAVGDEQVAEAAPAGEDPALVVRNASSKPVCYVNISQSDSERWGPDRLGPNEVLDPGEVRGWRLPPNAYDVRLIGCDRQPLLDRRAIAVRDAGILMTLN